MLKGRKAVSEIEEFENLIKKRPDDDRAYVRLAELYARNGNEDRAIELYEKAALIFEKKGFLNKAKAVLKQALMINSEHGKINVLLADYDRQSGLIKDAIMRYQIAVNYYAKIGNKIAAVNILRKIVELNPNNINFILKLCSLLVEEKMYHEAEKLLTPLAGELKGTGKVNEYAATLKLLYTASDNDSEIGKDLVNLYLKNSSYSNALIVLQKLIIDDPDSIEFLEKLAFVFEKLGQQQKLIAALKQIAVILSKKQNFTERENIYRKILELDPDDREALSALKEEGKLRNIISEKIDGSSNELPEFDEDEQDDLVIDVDVDMEEDAGSFKEVSAPGLDIETVLKEAKVFMSYNLYNKAIDRLQSCSEWKTSPEALDILIQAYIGSGETNSAGDLLIILIDLMLENGNFEDVSDLISDAESILGEDDERLLARKQLIEEVEAAPVEDVEAAPVEDVEASPVEEVEASPVEEVESPLVEEVGAAPVEEVEDIEDETVDMISDISSGTLLSGEDEEPKEKEERKESSFENLTSDILSELLEPPQTQLDELEFYISIEDFSSATQLLQELLINYPQSRFLAGIREILPVGEEEDLSGTIDGVREAETGFLGDNPSVDQLYDTALSNLSMGMFSEAISIFTQALEYQPENIACLTGLSEAYESAGLLEKSIESLEKALDFADDKEMATEIKAMIKEKKTKMDNTGGNKGKTKGKTKNK